MTLIDRFEGRRLTFNDTLIYRCGRAAAANPHAPDQPETDTPYTGKIADFTNTSIGVRTDGFMGKEPLYYVFPSSLISVLPQKDASRLNHRRTRG